jgi:hypothetical protein
MLGWVNHAQLAASVQQHQRRKANAIADTQGLKGAVACAARPQGFLRGLNTLTSTARLAPGA